VRQVALADVVFVTKADLVSTQSREALVARQLNPVPRLREGRALGAAGATALIDISDGLSTDLTHILEESKVSARIYKDRLPAWPGTDDRHVLHGGEEYELIIVGPPDLPRIIENVTVTPIGEIIESQTENQAFLIDGSHKFVLRPEGWQHFG